MISSRSSDIHPAVDIESGGSSGNSAGRSHHASMVDAATTTTTSTTTTNTISNTNESCPSTTETTAATATTEPTTTAASEAIPKSSMQQTAMNGFAGLGFVTSFISMMAEYTTTAIQHPAMVVSGCLGLVLSPYAKFQQEKLTQVKALEQTNSVLEEELKYLQQQHEEMTKHVQAVNASTAKLRLWQSTLSTIQSTNAQSMDQLEQQVQQSRDLLSQFQQNKQAMVLQNLITVLVHCDRDRTMTLDDQEIDSLIQSLESIHNVQFNETKVRQVILDQQRSITAIMELARNVISNADGTVLATETDTTKPLITTTTNTVSATTNAAATDTSPTRPSDTATIEHDTIFSFLEQ